MKNSNILNLFIIIIALFVCKASFAQENNDKTILPIIQNFLLNEGDQVTTIGDKVAGTDDKEATPQIIDTWNDSLMLDNEELNQLTEAIKSYDQNIPLEILLPDLFKKVVVKKKIVKKKPKRVKKVIINPAPKIEPEVKVDKTPKIPTNIPIIYLKSIMYFSDDNWTIWINDKKISTGEYIDYVDIVQVSQDKVVFMWPESYVDYIVPKWKSTFKKIDEDQYTNNKNIVIDGYNQNISFLLQPKQAFNLKKLAITEGDPEKTAIEVKSEDIKANALENALLGNKNNKDNNKNKAKPENNGNISAPLDQYFEEGSPMDLYMNQIDTLRSVLGQ